MDDEMNNNTYHVWVYAASAEKRPEMAFIPFWLPLDEYVGEPIHHFVRGGLVCALTAGAVDARRRNDFNHSILPFDWEKSLCCCWMRIDRKCWWGWLEVKCEPSWKHTAVDTARVMTGQRCGKIVGRCVSTFLRLVEEEKNKKKI